MENIFDVNGLVCLNEQDIDFRESFVRFMSSALKENLYKQNRAWIFKRIESSVLIPNDLINKNYTEEDIYKQGNCNLTLRPETTQGSYEYAKKILDNQIEKIRLPLCVWQVGKSFRREQDQATKYMRLKEFYQLEFQCIYSASTKNDYSLLLIQKIKEKIEMLIGNCRIEESDRLPSYSEKTVDIIWDNNDMELCSVSIRNDSPIKDSKVLEVAIGVDRINYCFNNKQGNK